MLCEWCVVVGLCKVGSAKWGMCAPVSGKVMTADKAGAWELVRVKEQGIGDQVRLTADRFAPVRLVVVVAG